MSTPSASLARLRSLDRRWFAAFLGLQALVLAAGLLASPMLLLLAALGLAGGLYAVLVLLHPWLIAPIIVLTTSLDATGRLVTGASESFNLTGFHLAFLLTVVAVVANSCLRRRMAFPAFELQVPLLVFLAVMAVSLIYSPNHPQAAVGFVRVACLVLFLYLTQLLLESKQAVAAVVWTMALVTVAGAVMGAYQVITGRFHLPVKVIEALGGNVPRATGTFRNPNIFASFLVAGVLPPLALLLNHRMALVKRVLLLVSLLVGLGGLLATFSRSSWMAGMVGIMVVLWLSGKLRYFFAALLAGVVGVLALRQFVPFAEYIFERFVSIFTLIEQFGAVGSASGSARVFLVVAAVHMFVDHPLLGVGWRGFPIAFHQYAPVGFPHWTRVDESHTVLATVLAELGLVGFLAFVWFLVRTLRRGLSALPQMRDSYLRAMLIGMIATFVAFQVSQSFNGDLTNNTFWFYTGVLFAVIHLDEKQRRP
ncbi:MAG: O-antigen ligase family protein [Candidatus Latescibacterota bacterium]